MKFLSWIKREYFSWKNIIKSKRIGISDYNDIKAPLPKMTILKHGGIGVIINKDAKIGKFCRIGQNVTIGNRNNGVPIIEDFVDIKANAVVIGDITVGHDSVIGAGAVVYKDVPPYSLVIGDCRIIEGKYE
jgi:serine acetyltransferase